MCAVRPASRAIAAERSTSSISSAMNTTGCRPAIGACSASKARLVSGRSLPAGKERPETNLAFDALQAPIAGRQPVVFMADEMLEVLRSAAIAREAGLTAHILGDGDEYKRVKEIVTSATPMIVPVNFPEAPDVSDPDQIGRAS